MPLTEISIKNSVPVDRPTKLFDAGGLYLLVKPNGSRWWRLKYRVAGKEQLLSLGVYPEVSLRAARLKRDETRKLLADGVDPGVHRKVEKIRTLLASDNTFESVAREWMTLQSKRLSHVTLGKAKWMLETFIFPSLGKTAVDAITAPDLLAALRKIEAKGAHETAHRTKARCGQVFRYAIATGRAQRDPSADLRGALAPVVSVPRAAITDPKRIGELLRAIDGYTGAGPTLAALRLAPLVFVRPGELRKAEWSEIDLQAAEWRIPAARMKMREEHIVPLSTQAVAVLREIQSLTGDGRFVFPSIRAKSRAMSDNTINAALRRLGYSTEDMTGHGFRALASTRLNEIGWPPDVIERQLAHAERDKVRAVYNRAQYLPERRKMMQGWADYLDGLRRGQATPGN